MLYDLNIPWYPSISQDQLLQTLSLASSLGYATVALNHTLSQPPSPNQPSPFPILQQQQQPSQSTTTTTTTMTTTTKKLPKLPHILHRATIPFSDPSSFTYRLPSLSKTYDLIAVRPTTDKAFQNACLTLDVPIISVDLSQQLPFYFKPKPCMAAVARGVRFEICYSQALSSGGGGGGGSARARCIANASGLVRATRGRGIFISSEAGGVMGLRAPADVVNLLAVWGLASEKGLEGLGMVPRSVVVNEGVKRSGFRGVVDIVKVAEGGRQQHRENEEQGGGGSGSSGKGKNQKRKSVGGDEQQQNDNSGGKRQTKKMKLVVHKKTTS